MKDKDNEDFSKDDLELLFEGLNSIKFAREHQKMLVGSFFLSSGFKEMDPSKITDEKVEETKSVINKMFSNEEDPKILEEKILILKSKLIKIKNNFK